MVTGGAGFLGRHVCMELKSRGYKFINVVGKSPFNKVSAWCSKNGFDYYGECDLRKYEDTRDAFSTGFYGAVINLAASVGGIGANQTSSADFMMDTLKIGTNMIEVAKNDFIMSRCGGKFVQLGTVCAYPKYTPIPFKEEDIWNGYPEETNAAYGIAKKTIMELIKQTNLQYKDTFNGINLVPVNLYGPGDNFDLESSHVIPALIRKFITAKEHNLPQVVVWGTGSASREFLFVKDAAIAIVNAMEQYEGNDFINIGSGNEIVMRDLVSLIRQETEYQGEVIFDTSKPDGQPRRCLDVQKAKEKFNFTAKTTFLDGLRETIEWYKNEWHME